MATISICSRRLNLKSVLASHDDLSSSREVMLLTKKFDMCRIFASGLNDLHVSKYAVLEHIMRITTQPEEIEPYFDQLPRDISLTLQSIFHRKSETHQMALRELETFLTADIFNQIPDDLPSCLVLYRFLNAEMTKVTLEPEEAGRWPIVHCFQSKNVLYLLYPAEVSFLDGYEPATGGYKEPFIPPSIMGTIVPALYFTQKRITTSSQTQTKRPKGTPRVSPHGSLSSEVIDSKPTIEPGTRPVEIGASVGLQKPILPVFYPVTVNRAVSVLEPQLPEQKEPTRPVPIPSAPKAGIVPTPPIPSISTIAPLTITSPSKPETSPQRISLEIGASVGLSLQSNMSIVRPSQFNIERVEQVSVEPRGQASQPLPLSYTTKKIVIHRSHVSKKSASPEPDYHKTMKDEFANAPTEKNWEWVNFDREPGKSGRPREGCGLVEDCGLF